MEKKIIKWAVVGLGKISKRMTRVIQSAEGCVVEACVSSSKERAIAYGKKFNIPHCLTYDELAQNPSLVDAVYISTHMNYHAEPAIKFLNQKLPVLVEKTFAITLKEAQSMVDAAKENDTLLMEAMWTRFQPANIKLMEVLNSGEVGKILSTKASFEVGLGHTRRSRVFKREVGGGSLLDVGVYPTNYTHMLLGMPEKVEASGKTRNGVDICCDAIFTYSDGAVAKIRCSHEPFTLKEYYKIECENATIIVPSFFDARKFRVKYKDGKSKLYKGYGRRGKPDGFIWEILHFSDLVRDGIKESPVMTHQVTLDVVDLIEKQMNLLGVGY